MNMSCGSISDSEMSDVNITHSSCDNNDDDERSNSAHQRHPSAASSVPSSSPSSSPVKKKRAGQVSESEEYDEENGELDPLARMLSTPTPGEEGEDNLSSSPAKIPKVEQDRKSESDLAMPAKASTSKAAASSNKSSAVLSSPSPSSTPSPTKENEKEAERRAEMRSKREAEEEEREKMQVLVSNFTEEQLDRYEMYRRSAFPKAAIKRVHLLHEQYSVNELTNSVLLCSL